MGGCKFGNILPINVPKCHREKVYVFLIKFSKSSVFYYLEPGLYPSITDNVEAANTLIQERHKHSENYITVKVSRRTQKFEIYLANEKSVLAFFSTELGHHFGSNVGNEFGVVLKGKGPLKPEFAYDIVGIHSLMVCTDLIEYNIVGDTETLCCVAFAFIPKPKAEGILTTGEYMSYQIFSNLQFRPLLKKPFHSFNNDLRNTSRENIPFVSVGIAHPVLMVRKASNIQF